MELIEFLNTKDCYAANAGAELKEVRDGYARAEMTVTDAHLNAGGVCQGGALFTLADLALAAVMNSRGMLTFSVESNISFLKSAFSGDVLIAEAVEIQNHHKLPYCEVKIFNQHGELICVLTGIGYRKNRSLL